MRFLAAFAVGLTAVALAAALLYVRFSSTRMELMPVAERAPLSTPLGVTYQLVRSGTVLTPFTGKPVPNIVRAYAGANGMPLYFFDNDAVGKSNCVGECAATWSALAAPAEAGPFGEWTILTRQDGSRQWALRGRPLYTYANDPVPGEANGNGVGGVWHLVLFDAAQGFETPDGIAVADVPKAGGQVFVNEQGMPLYVNQQDRGGDRPVCTARPCTDHWSPYLAGELAQPVNGFTVMMRRDGISQWAFKGQPLYVYDGDIEQGDVNGDGVDGKWHAAMAFRDFMPEGVVLVRNRFGGANLGLSNGRALYIRDRVVPTETGQNPRTGSRGNPIVGKMLGVAACEDDCVKTWTPMIAPAGAQPSGHWEIVTRPEGVRQWSYRGYPLYFYAHDVKPGDMLGNETYEILAKNDPFQATDLIVPGGMGAMVWRVANP